MIGTTVVLGIPIPSTDPSQFIGIHVLFGLAAVITGGAAMLSQKGRGRHSNFGTIYFWCLFGVFVSMSVLSFMRWAENYHLFVLGVLSFAAALFGRTAVQRRWHQWPRLVNHVRYWHLADVQTALMNVRFEGNNGHHADLTRCLLLTHSRHLRLEW